MESPKNGRGTDTDFLVGNRVGRLAHQLLDVLDAAHLAVDLLQHLSALLQTKYHILLDQGELDAGRELLQLFQLSVCLSEERLLVLLAAEGEECALLVVLC